VDPARAPGVRRLHGYEERTVTILTAATGKWSRAQWVPADCVWRSQKKAAEAYSVARALAKTDRQINIQMAAVRLREADRNAGWYDPVESA
jgi:hypothetical protein